jgi:hypothetical protein
MMKALVKTSLIFLLAIIAQGAGADMVVVASPKSSIEHLSRQEVVYLYMGRLRQLPSGIPAVPLDLAVDSPERADFYRQLVSKEPAEIRAYWARLIFSGGTHPPLMAENREDMIQRLNSKPGAIGYLERAKVDSRVKVVFEFAAPP